MQIVHHKGAIRAILERVRALVDKNIAKKLLHDNVSTELFAFAMHVFIEAKRQQVARCLVASANGVLLQRYFIFKVVFLEESEAFFRVNVENLNVISEGTAGGCNKSGIHSIKPIAWLLLVAVKRALRIPHLRI